MAYQRKEQPGFLVMYDLIPALQKLSKEQVGEFVLAMAEFSQLGVQPDFSDDARMDTLWITTEQTLTRNKANYKARCDSGSYAGWCSSLADAGKAYLKIPREDYLLSREQYEVYCANLPSAEAVPLFNDWLHMKRERDGNFGSEQGRLPFDDPYTCTS